VDEQVHEETVQYGSKAIRHLDEQDQQLHPVLSECGVGIKIFLRRAIQSAFWNLLCRPIEGKPLI
jgi:hypothetical protein